MRNPSTTDPSVAPRAAIERAASAQASIEAMVELCTYLDANNRGAEALVVARQATAAAEAICDERLMGWSLFRQMMALRNLGRLEEVVGLAARTREHFQFCADLVGDARASSLQALVLLGLGHHDQGLKALVDSAALIERIDGSSPELMNTLHVQAAAFQQLSAFELGVRASERARTAADALGDPVESAWARYQLGDQLVVWADALGPNDSNLAEQLRERALVVLAEADSLLAPGDGVRELIRLTRGLALLGTGNVQDGVDTLAAVLSAPGFERNVESARLSWRLGQGHLRLGDISTARTCLDDAIRALGQTDCFGWLSSALRDRAKVLRVLGDAEGAIRDIERALDVSESRRAVETAQRANGILSRIDVELRNIDLVHRESKADELQRMAMVDPLTGLANRRALDEEAIASRAAEHGAMSVAVVDVDNFKRINDAFSHLTGDAVLRTVADILRGCVRSDVDIVARYAGDEFVLCLLGFGSVAAGALCERVRAAVAGHRWGDISPDLAVTVSIGVASGVAPAGLWALFADADSALFEAKSAGRNRSAAFQG